MLRFLSRTSHRRSSGPAARPGPLAAALLAALLLGSPATASATAERAVRLKTSLQGQHATAVLTVPADWRGAARGDHVELVAPSSRKGCDHLLRLRLNLLYVASSVTAPEWVAERLSDQGPVLAQGGTDYAWGVAARAGRRTSAGEGALVAGTGRFGRIMAEVRATTALTRSCTTAQSRLAAKRLVRVLQNAAVQSARRGRAR